MQTYLLGGDVYLARHLDLPDLAVLQTHLQVMRLLPDTQWWLRREGGVTNDAIASVISELEITFN